MALVFHLIDRSFPRAVFGWLVRPGGFCLGLLAGLVMAVIAPGLAPWINDEAKLLNNAWLSNTTGWPAKMGLLGTQGYFYGPAPTWFYQLALLVTHDIYGLVTIHAVLFYTATLMAGWFLTRTAGFPTSSLLILAFAPGICFYSRQLWDNSFNIPISIGLLALYASQRGRAARWKLMLLGAGCVLAMGIHLSAVTLVVVLLIHAWLANRQRVKSWIIPFMMGAVLMLLAHLPYIGWQISILTGAVPKPVLINEGLVEGYPYAAFRQSRTESIFFAWTGGRILTASFSIMPRFESGYLSIGQDILGWITQGMYVFFVIGLVGVLIGFLKYKFKRFIDLPSSMRDLVLIGVGVILCNSLLFAVIRPVRMDHYFNGSFSAYLVVILAGVSVLIQRGWKVMVILPVLCLGGYTGLCLLNLHQTKGRQLGYGPVLSEQLRVLQEVENRGAGGFHTNVVHFVFFPHAVRTLWRLDPPTTLAKSDALWPVVKPMNPHAGRLLVEEKTTSQDQTVPLPLHVPAKPIR
jgi:hypothetical protein